jgi:choline dehydrogenase-like flavoprotein
MALDPAEGDFDAVVVGSGAGGGAAAFGLTRAGLRTCVLEKGPHYRDEDFFHDELAVTRRSFFVPSVFDEPNVVARNGGPASPSADGWISCCVGGGTVHMMGWMFRMAREDLAAGTRFAKTRGSEALDWPVPYEELVRAYDEIEEVIGVSGDAATLPVAQRSLPLAPIAQHPGAAALLEQGARQYGTPAFQPPRAILSAAYRGRAACHYCGFCAGYGCEVGAKSSTAASLLREAATTGKLTLRPRAQVLRIEADATGRARAVIWRDEHGTERQSRGKAIVVAAGAIQSARLLLLSGLATRSGHLGRHLILGTTGLLTADYALPHPVFGAPGGKRDFPFAERAVRTADGTIIWYLPGTNPIHDAQEAAKHGEGQPPLWGDALTARLKTRFRESRRMVCETFAEFVPHRDCYVELDDTTRDKHGLAVARIHAALHDHTRERSWALHEHGGLALGMTGGDIKSVTRDGFYWFLQAGTARMARTDADGVVGPDGQSFEHPGLYVADGAALPSTGGAPFTLTIMANALRIAQRIPNQ